MSSTTAICVNNLVNTNEYHQKKPNPTSIALSFVKSRYPFAQIPSVIRQYLKSEEVMKTS